MPTLINLQPNQFNYQITGDPNAVPILFLHGFMGDATDFDPIISTLASSFYCIAIDLPGHGKTQVSIEPHPHTLSQITQGLVQLMDHLKIKPCYLVGYSMGGRIALYLSLKIPGYFRGVILESGSPGLKTQFERDQRLQQDQQLAQQLETEPWTDFLTAWYHQPLFSHLQTHPDFAALIKKRLKNDPGCLAQVLRTLSPGLQPSLWEHLPRLSLPLLLVVGELDPKFVEINTEMQAINPQIQLQVVELCGHTIHFEKPDSFAQILRSFFNAQGDT